MKFKIHFVTKIQLYIIYIDVNYVPLIDVAVGVKYDK